MTNLFPSRSEPGRGIFNLRQLVPLAEVCDLEVIAPVPWVPRLAARFGTAWRRRSVIPRQDVVAGIPVRYPRYPVVPKTFRSWHAPAATLALRRPLAEAQAARPVDVVLATWAYPDVVAAVAVAGNLGLPVVAKVHGSDVLGVLRSQRRRRAVVAALERSRRVVAVSRELAAQLVALGIAAERIEVIGNGVDTHEFRPLDRREARRLLGLPPDPPRIVFVGRLEPVKGVDVLLEAASRLSPGVALSVVGDGSWRDRLVATARSLGISARVGFVGERPSAEIAAWLNAADTVCVPSRSEGCPNVALEALSCATPVVGSDVGGLPEIVAQPGCGTLVAPGDAAALAGALHDALSRRWDRGLIRASVLGRTWERSATRLLGVMRAALVEEPPCAGSPAS